MMNENQNGSGVLKRFIRYLYEYEQGKRMRNVGFVKVEQGEDECMVHIHGKGLRMGGESSLQIYLLFEEEGVCYGIWQGEADNINPAVNECISYTAEEAGTPENYRKINGIALENKDGRRYAALWSDTPIDISDMRIWEPGKDEEQTALEEAPKEYEEEPLEEGLKEYKEGPLEEDSKEYEEEPLEEDLKEYEEKLPAESMQKETQADDWTDEEKEKDSLMDAVPVIKSEGIFFAEDQAKPRIQRAWRTKKIQRTELAKLARCEWRLANNNFLLHGYYNYHHLILLERGAQVMLGVPGIYHEKEAAAAGAFGFAEFIAKDRLDVKLSPEECNDEHPFGYWCRPVKQAFKWE